MTVDNILILCSFLHEKILFIYAYLDTFHAYFDHFSCIFACIFQAFYVAYNPVSSYYARKIFLALCTVDVKDIFTIVSSINIFTFNHVNIQGDKYFVYETHNKFIFSINASCFLPMCYKYVNG